MNNEQPSGPNEIELSGHSWLYDHIGRIAGVTLGTLAFGFLAFLAAIGSTVASSLIVIVLVGVAILIVGGRMRGA